MNNFGSFLSTLDRKSSVFIQSHNYPDPDSIASAVALQFILENSGIQSKVVYSGRIVNKTVIDLINKFNLEIFNLNEVNINKESKIFIVDTQFNSSNIYKIAANYIGEIDHHVIETQTALQYSDVRPEIGACSSILAQYIFDLDLTLSESIATLLLTGIFIDTNRLSRKVSSLDVEMVYKLFPFADIEFLNYLVVNSIEIPDLKLFSKGIKSFKYKNDIAVVSIGKIASPHLLAIICDFFIQLKEINLVVGYAEISDKIFISLRSEVKKYPADIISRKISEGIGSAGGHINMAAGIIDKKKYRNKFGLMRFSKFIWLHLEI